MSEPLFTLKPFLAEYGWAFAMGYHILFMVMLTKLVFSKKQIFIPPMGGCTTPTSGLDYMDIASENLSQNFYFPVKYLLGIVDI